MSYLRLCHALLLVEISLTWARLEHPTRFFTFVPYCVISFIFILPQLPTLLLPSINFLVPILAGSVPHHTALVPSPHTYLAKK
jgi:hypothetical protein